MVVTKEVTVSSWVEGRLLLFIVQAKPGLLTLKPGIGIIKAQGGTLLQGLGESPGYCRSNRQPWRGDGYFFLYVRQSPIMAQINNPNWIISLYVTYISLTPFAKASGTYKEARPRFKGDSRSALAAASLGIFYHRRPCSTRVRCEICQFSGDSGGFTIDFAGQGWYTKRREKGAREPLNEILLRPFGVLPDGRFLSGIFETDVL